MAENNGVRVKTAEVLTGGAVFRASNIKTKQVINTPPRTKYRQVDLKAVRGIPSLKAATDAIIQNAIRNRTAVNAPGDTRLAIIDPRENEPATSTENKSIDKCPKQWGLAIILKMVDPHL